MNKPSVIAINEKLSGSDRASPRPNAIEDGIFRRRFAIASRVWGVLFAALLFVGVPAKFANAQTTVNIADIPLLALKAAPGLVMLTMSKDHRLFYAAYNDASDLNADGIPDIGFKPTITYYGNFASDRCYLYDNGRFSPKDVAKSSDGCLTAASSARWHGNWLNWATTSRMDALRRVLYGGHRITDPTTSASPTVLQGAFIPQDSHVWGKEYRPVTGRDSYNITYYTDLAAPTAGKQHLFAVRSYPYASGTTPANAGSGTYPFPMPAPALRVILNADQVTDRIWKWTAADGNANIAADTAFGITSTAYTLKVEACVTLSGAREAGCTGYPTAAPTVWKPTGVLHEYSVNDQLKFGLLTGSYRNNYSGGVVRRNIASFKDEVNPANGVFRQVTEGTATVDGIARTIDRISIYGWKGDGYHCDNNFNSLQIEGACPSWGAPIGEMMYEGLRYFAGKGSGFSAYANGVNVNNSGDSRLQLPLMGTGSSPWQNPFRLKSAGGSPICSRPVQMVIADPVTTFDNDELPYAYFDVEAQMGNPLAPPRGDLAGVNVSTEADIIWGKAPLPTPTPTNENLGTRNVFVGQSGTASDGNPTAKSANSFANIQGHAPDATQSRGSFYSAAIARFGKVTGFQIGNPPSVPMTATNATVDTIAVALGSVVPKIEISYGGKKVSLVPVSKSVGPSGYVTSAAFGAFQPTGSITGFYLDTFNNTSGTTGPDYNAAINGGRPTMSFVVNFSDTDAGGDNETDAVVGYTVSVNAAGKIVVALAPINTSAADIEMHLGYTITGTTKDGLYLDMSSRPLIGGVRKDPQTKYYLDTLLTPTVQDPAPANGTRANGTVLPHTATSRTLDFATSSTVSGYIPHDALWYAAKYGGAGLLDANGDPTNYFKVNNPANLPDQMAKAFRSAAALAAVASTSVVGVGQRSLGSAAIYQANYDSLTWTSRLYAFSIATSGAVSNTPIWEVSSKIPVPASRTKLFLGRGGTTPPVSLTSSGYASLTGAEQTDFVNAATYQYLLGEKSGEERKGGAFRNRGTTAAADYGSVLGDIVNSDPQIISAKNLNYALSDATYTSFLSTINFETLAVGTNSGFFHIFDAEPDTTGGVELLGFMPQAVRSQVKNLADPGYQHQNLIDGSIAVSHAKIAVPGDATTNWRTVVVAAGGSGAKTVFAINATSKTFTADSVLWEINSSSAGIGTTFGNIMGRPGVGKLADGTWVAIFGNGYNSTAGTANLYVVRLSDGNILRIIPTNASIANNGLGAVELVRKTSGNQDTIEYVYGADYKGNIWRFDPSSGSAGALIYTTPTGRPITAEIKVGAAPTHVNTNGGKMIYFGTGSYLSATDPAVTTVQALYGIYDDLLHGLSTTPFVVESNLSSMTISMPAPVGGVASDVRTTSAGATPDWYTVSGKKGWVVPLTGTNVTPGERVIAPPVRYTIPGVVDAFLFTSIVPSVDDCAAGLDAWITGVDALTGGYKKVFSTIVPNSVRVAGGSPRGVFVLQDNGPPALYISQTIFNDTIATTTYSTSVGGQQTVCINGVCGKTQVLQINLTPPSPTGASAVRQIWRQLK
ncbi:MAG TPA: PilC/PilY family type IV pilus protein [Polaromonas sp.]|uniref:pilus assembly protein n=1 Tax=Polaromonas sp. TaxID=1869339 RepID=UPI002D4B7B82|nr:PilC/PilY family type IV pilus protein [Polaromonas sp.]HYW55702.1 PilC/PilY family type IV pilus protein [Polaromonas sp.]